MNSHETIHEYLMNIHEILIFTVTVTGVYTCSLTGHDTMAVLKFYYILFFYESVTTVLASL